MIPYEKLDTYYKIYSHTNLSLLPDHTSDWNKSWHEFANFLIKSHRVEISRTNGL